MSVAFRSIASVSQSGDLAFGALPFGTTTDDILVLIVGTNAGGTITAPTGYTEVGASPQASATTLDNGTKLGVYWKRAAAGETPPTLTDPSSADGAHAQLLAFSGCVTSGSPWDTSAGTVYERPTQNTSTATFYIDSSTDYDAWTHTANLTGSGGAVSFNSTATDADGVGSNGQISHRATGRTVSCTNRSSLTLTPADYGVPSTARVIGTGVTYAWRCSEYTTGASSSLAIGGPPTNTANTFTSTTSFADNSDAFVRNAQQGSDGTDPSSPLTITFTSTLATGNSASAAVTVLIDYLRVKFYYVDGSPFTFPSLVTSKSNEMIVMAASCAYSFSSTGTFTSLANANLTSVATRSSTAALITTTIGKCWAGTGFSALAQDIGQSTVNWTNGNAPIALWTGALIGTDSVTPSAGYVHSGWGIPLNSA